MTWIGGTMQTRIHLRSLQLEQLRPILRAFTCVSAQYSPQETPWVGEWAAREGLPIINKESAGADLHEQAALFSACDAVVTVQQTAVHVAGGLGVPTFALISSRPHWRYGTEGDSLPFYSSVRMYRQKEHWNEPIKRVLQDLHAHFGSLQRATETTA